MGSHAVGKEAVATTASADTKPASTGVACECAICMAIPARSSALWKGGEELYDDLPAALGRLSAVGGPFYDTDISHTNASLLQCPECGTYYARDVTHEYLTNGAEDEVGLKRLSHEDGERRAQAMLRTIEAHRIQLVAQAPQHIEALQHAPRNPKAVEDAARFFYQGQQNRVDIAFALPALLGALKCVSPKRSAASLIDLVLFCYAGHCRANLEAVRAQARAAGLEGDDRIKGCLVACEKALRHKEGGTDA